MSSRRVVSVAVFAAVSVALSALSCSGDDEAEGSPSAAGAGGGASGATASVSGAGGVPSGGATSGGATSGGAAGCMASGGAAGSPMPGGDMTADEMDEPVMVGFEADVWPVLRASCDGAGCHGEGSFLPEHANPDVEVAFEEASPVADRIAGRVAGLLTPIMPQGCGPAPGVGMCLSLEEVALIRAWVEQGAPF